jgi:hypothetical protein
MPKIKGCKINKKSAQIIMETLRNDSSLRGDEIMKISRILQDKCSKVFRGT